MHKYTKDLNLLFVPAINRLIAPHQVNDSVRAAMEL